MYAIFMHRNALYPRIHILIIAALLLTACTAPQPDPKPVIHTSTPRPTETRIPTVTPIPGSIPNAGILARLSTPEPTYTLLPNPTRYDPLSTAQTAQAVLPTNTPQPSSTPVPQNTVEPIPTGVLTGGVLGLIPSPQGLWAMRPDGTQMTLITADPIDAMFISPGGRLAVYLTHPNANLSYSSQPFDYTIKLITLYNNLTYPIANIDPPAISAGSTLAELDAAAQALAAYQYGAAAWSPDGGRVAFTASHEAAPGQPASSDIYIYTPSSGGLHRLTQLSLPQGPAHPYNLQWSPDGSRLFYMLANQFSTPGTSSGALYSGAWVVTMDGGAVQVADGLSSSGENLIAWLPGATLLLSSNVPLCGEGNIRLMNLLNGSVSVLWPGCFTDMVYERAYSQLLVSITPALASVAGSPAEGLYVVPLNQTGPRQITSTGFEKLYRGDSRTPWYGYNTGQGLFSITRSGEMAASFSGVSPNEQNGVLLKPLARLSRTDSWLWSGDPSGLYFAAKGEPPRLVLDMVVEGWTSSPSYPGLYFFYSPDENGSRLYGVRSSDWQPFPVEDRLAHPGSVRWAP